MKKTIFVLGRPGSGKSTATRALTEQAWEKGVSTERINDYPILKAQYLADTEYKQFLPTPEGGFDAIDLSVMDTALKKVEEEALQKPTSGIQVVTIEFARTSYEEALQHFTRQLIDNSYVLFLDASIETCLQRIHERVAHHRTKDDTPSFPDQKFRSYYG